MGLRGAGRRDTWVPPYNYNIFVGQGPRALPWVREKNPPVTALPCQPPLGKGPKDAGDRKGRPYAAFFISLKSLAEFASADAKN